MLDKGSRSIVACGRGHASGPKSCPDSHLARYRKRNITRFISAQYTERQSVAAPHGPITY